jgi:hypothetical protein
VLFRIFLLIPALMAGVAQAQEAAAPESVPVPVPAETTPAPAATQVPLNPAALLSIGAPRSKEERDEMAARATTLHAEAKRRREVADPAHEVAQAECWKKFLVSACLDEARTAHRKEISLAKRQEREAQTLERNVRKYDALERARIRDEENAKREAENAKKAEKHRAKRAAEDKAEKQK